MLVYDKLHRLNGIVVNVYLFEAEDGLIMVDTGMRGRPRTLDYLTKIGYEPADITHILVTHADVDHVGNLAAVQKATDAIIIASEATAALLIEGKTPPHGEGWMGKFAEKFRGMGTYDPVAAESIQIVQDGEQLPVMDGLSVVATPGHTHDHISFYSLTHGIVFTGDALNSTGGSLSLMSPSALNFDHDIAAASATKLINLSPVLFACGHGKPFIHDHTHLEALDFVSHVA